MQPKPNLTVLLLLVLLWAGCKQKKAHSDSSSTTTQSTTYPNYSEQTGGTQTYTSTSVDEPSYYDDGTYCATVRYSNGNTSTNSIYILTVEVEDGKLTKIHWPNGGWLDASHFDPPHVSENGFATFTSDKGYEYDVLIKSSGECNNTSFNTYSDNGSTWMEDEDEEEDEETKLENEYGSVQAIVYKRVSGCDYMILEERGDYYVAEWMGSYDPNEGDRIQGNLRSYGTKTCYVRNRERESRLYIEDYRITLSRAWEIIREKCDLEEEEEEQ
jgi:hypothetical protein